jgi:hypothetical protein
VASAVLAFSHAFSGYFKCPTNRNDPNYVTHKSLKYALNTIYLPTDELIWTNLHRKKFQDTYGTTRIHKLKKERHHNDQTKKDKCIKVTNKQMHVWSFFWLSTSTASGDAKLVLWTQKSPLSEMMTSCNCIPPLSKMSTLTYSWANSMHYIFNIRDTCISLVFSGVRVTRSLVLCVVFRRSLFVHLSFFVWSLWCLSFFNLWILVVP